VAGPGVGALGTASLSDATHVVAAAGLPLYRFAGDSNSGDAYGEGMASFGGIWHVVRVGQSTSAAATATASPATPHRTPSTMASSRAGGSY